MNVKASEQRPLRKGHQTELAKNVVSPVDAREKGLCPLAVHPFRYRAIGSIAEPVLPLNRVLLRSRLGKVQTSLTLLSLFTQFRFRVGVVL